MDAFAGGAGVLLGYGKKQENLLLWDMAESKALRHFEGSTSPVCASRGLFEVIYGCYSYSCSFAGITLSFSFG